MNIAYPRLCFPQNLQLYAREVVEGIPTVTIPKGWQGILIYHPATGQYYSTKSSTPYKYADIVHFRKEPRWSSLAFALRKMLELHPDYQFFILPIQSRGMVEQWLASQGKRRVATKMGEMAQVEHVLYRVYSPFNKVTRCVVAPVTTSKEELIELANKSFAQWLNSRSDTHRHERNTMRVALRSTFATNTMVFGSDAQVIATKELRDHKHNEFRWLVIEENLKAIREFILTTTTGQ